MRYCALLLVLCFAAFAQQPAPPPSDAPPDTKELVAREFGKSFTVIAGNAPIYGDFDNDGQQDAAIVVTSQTPLVDQTDFKYRAIDPYNAYWGWGNPRETVQFSATSVGPPRYIAILHNWRAPKAKFLVINLPFEKLTMSRVTVKKKPVASLHAAESGGLESDIFWDGKKYKWDPSSFN